MAKISEETLSSWTKPPSDSEESKLSNAERMVKDAINVDEKLKSKSIEIFGQGSYANDTNVRLNSDIDINVHYTGGFYFTLPPDTKENDVGLDKLPPTNYTVQELKNDVENALINKFGREFVKREDKCLNIVENNYRINTDVIPTWSYRSYNKNSTYDLGVKFITEKSFWIENYPKQHIENGKVKNSNTSKRFKRLTRIFRKLRYKMIDDGESVSNNITSFLLECLVWNVPNKIFNDNISWSDRLRDSIIHLYDHTKEIEKCKEWGEVSELLYLFHSERKWSRADVNNFLVQVWNFLEYE